MAAEHSPVTMDWQARWIAVRDDEHAVSTAMLGPVKSKKWETRLAIDQCRECASVGTPSAFAAPLIHS
ncbi:hypothetical protein SALBM135S_02413 [Streptomyces alboniger]